MNGETMQMHRHAADPPRSTVTTPRTSSPTMQFDPQRILGNQLIARHATSAAAASGDSVWRRPDKASASAVDSAKSRLSTTRGPAEHFRVFGIQALLRLQRKCECGGTGTSCGCEEKKRVGIQKKVKVGPVDDPFEGGSSLPPSVRTVNTPYSIDEYEAERISEQVMRMSASQLQLTPSHGHERPPKTSAGPSAQESSAAPPDVHQVLRSPGQPLDEGVRTFMEPRFGHDFGRVRIHTDGGAARSAGQLRASAYTVGAHIVFAQRQFAPSTTDGSRVLAHELAHVVQGAGQHAVLRRKPDPQLSESQLRVQIVDALEAARTRALNAVISAIERADRAYLQGLQLTTRQVDDLLNRTSRFSTEFGTALERQIEQYVRANPDLATYVKKGPATVPRGIGKPDWIIETPSSRIPVELTTPEQLEKKLKMWRSQHPKGKPKWYVEKSVNLTYEIPPGLKTPTPPGTGLPAEAPRTPVSALGQTAGRTASALRTAGRFLAREAPGLALQGRSCFFFRPA